MVAFATEFASPRKGCIPKTPIRDQVQLSGLRYYKPAWGRGIARWQLGEDERSETAPVLLLIDGPVAILDEGTRVAGEWMCFSDDLERDPKYWGVPVSPRVDAKPHPCPGFKECTEKHENDHERTMGPACDAAIRAYDAAKTPAQRRKIKRRWKEWRRENRVRSECRAYRVSVDCFEAYYGEYGCDCPYEDNEHDAPEKSWRACCDLSVDEADLKRKLRADNCKFGSGPLDPVPDYNLLP